MDRKKTILIAVLINAGLLVLLFVVALHHEEPSTPSMEIVQSAEQRPLFDEVPLAPLAQAGDTLAALPPLSENSAPSLVVSESEQGATSPAATTVHPLPALATPEVISAPEVTSMPEPTEVKVKKGDSLDKIAKVYHTSVDEIIRLNHLPSSFLRIGQVLKIPKEIAKSGLSKSKNLVADRHVSNGQSEYYTVKVGDNPWTIANKHRMKVDELLKVNNLNDEKARRLKPGDRLRVR